MVTQRSLLPKNVNMYSFCVIMRYLIIFGMVCDMEECLEREKSEVAINIVKMEAFAGAIKSASRFDDTRESYICKQRPLFRPIRYIALSGRNFSLGHVLIGSILDSAVVIVHGD